MAAISVIERDYPNVYKQFTALGPLMSSIGNGGKGIAWKTEPEIELLGKLNGIVSEEGITKGLPRIETDIDATEVILSLAPETNGEVADEGLERAWRIHRPRTWPSRRGQGRREDPLPRHPGAAAQDHLVADLVRHRVRKGLLQCRLHQCA